MPQSVCLMVLIGLPAAGKTTFCRWLLETPQKHFKIVNLCYDDFLEFQQLPPQEPLTLDFFYKAQRIEIFKTIETIASALAHSKEIPPHILKKIKISDNPITTGDYIILCDDNHYYRSMRYKLFQLCKAQAYAFTQVYFECEQQLALERNAQRTMKTRLPEAVITQMAARLEAPLSSNNWETSTLTLYAADLKFSIDAVLLLAFKALEDIVVQETAHKAVDLKASEQQRTSLIHTLDIKLRRRISELLNTEKNKESKRSKAVKLNNDRKNILQQCRELVDFDEYDLDKYVDLLNKNSK